MEEKEEVEEEEVAEEVEEEEGGLMRILQFCTPSIMLRYDHSHHTHSRITQHHARSTRIAQHSRTHAARKAHAG